MVTPDQTNAEVSDERLLDEAFREFTSGLMNDIMRVEELLRGTKAGANPDAMRAHLAKCQALADKARTAILTRRSVTSQASEGAEPVAWRIDHPAYVGVYEPRFSTTPPHEDQLDGMLVTPLYASPSKRAERLEAANRALAEIKESFRIAGLGTIGAHWQSLIDAIDQALQGDRS